MPYHAIRVTPGSPGSTGASGAASDGAVAVNFGRGFVKIDVTLYAQMVMQGQFEPGGPVSMSGTEYLRYMNAAEDKSFALAAVPGTLSAMQVTLGQIKTKVDTL